jgi:hypothetical protein
VRARIRNGVVVLATVGLILWGTFSDALSASASFWSGAVVIPLAIGIAGFLVEGSVLARLGCVVLPPILYGAVYLPAAFSERADADAPVLLGTFISYWVGAGAASFVALYVSARLIRKK